ncbi:MAG: hypothetical protein WC934_08370 [Acidithiobacillus sp.]|jgi:hypothetical protein|uniref:hypothetical protein n=1 Tax=Acidithiobacillus sp. TaxID=1872118 RepID=UPI00355EB78D
METERRIGNIYICVGQDKSTKKWFGHSYIMHGNDIHTISLSSNPVFETAKDALDALEKGEKIKAEKFEKVFNKLFKSKE